MNTKRTKQIKSVKARNAVPNQSIHCEKTNQDEKIKRATKSSTPRAKNWEQAPAAKREDNRLHKPSQNSTILIQQ